MRGKKALINSFVDLTYEVVAIVCGFILPRLILDAFGSSYNGITASITQFISCIALLKSGVGGVTRAALYKPLAEKNDKKISEIIVATEKFMKKIAIIFAVFMLLFATIYPLFVKNDFSWFFAFSLVLIIGVSTIAEYYFGMTYQMLLGADQKQYVFGILQISTTILNTIIAAILINLNASIHVVKICSSLIFMLNPLALNIYVKKHYIINKKVDPDYSAIKQRWDAFALQFANFINNNTDLVILTIFTNIRIVSVYTVYYLVLNGIRKIIPKIATGIEAALGNIIALNQQKKLEEVFEIFEFLIMFISTLIFSVTLMLIVPFVKIYTIGITDTNYIIYSFAYISTIAEMFYCIRTPYQYLVQAAGKFRDNRNGSIIEAFLNISISLLLVNYVGITGVAIGTLTAMIFRTFQYAIYSYKKLLNWNLKIFAKKIIIFSMAFFLILIPLYIFKLEMINSFYLWIMYAVIFTLYAFAIMFATSYLFFNKILKNTIKKLKSIIKKSK